MSPVCLDVSQFFFYILFFFLKHPPPPPIVPLEIRPPLNLLRAHKATFLQFKIRIPFSRPCLVLWRSSQGERERFSKLVPELAGSVGTDLERLGLEAWEEQLWCRASRKQPLSSFIQRAAVKRPKKDQINTEETAGVLCRGEGNLGHGKLIKTFKH